MTMTKVQGSPIIKIALTQKYIDGIVSYSRTFTGWTKRLHYL